MLIWEYERDQYKQYRQEWNREHRHQQTLYRRRYREEHRHETLKQWQQDTARYRERMNPVELKARQKVYCQRYRDRIGEDVMKERHRIANARYVARKRAERAVIAAGRDNQ